MAWEVSTAAVQDGDPILLYYRDCLAERIREHFETLDRVVVLWRRSGKWLPTPFAIRLPTNTKERNTCPPEQGAAQLCELAFNWARDNDARYIKFEGYGMSKREETARMLFELRAEPQSEPDRDREDSRKKTDNAAIDAAAVLNDAVNRMGAQLDASFKREIACVDKVLDMASRQNDNMDRVIVGLSFQRQMRRDEQEHEERMEDLRAGHATTERVVDVVGKPFADIFEKVLARAFGLGEEAFVGSFAERLTAIVAGVDKSAGGNARLQQAKDLIGEDAWSVLLAMSAKKTTDDEFTAQGKKFVALLGENPTGKFRELAAILGEGPSMALLRLFADARIGDG